MSLPAENMSAPVIAVDVVHESGDWPDVASTIQRAASAAWDAAGDGGEAEVAVALLDDAAIRALNAEFRDKDKATDVLSFPAGESVGDEGADAFLGDIALALETVRRDAELEDKRFEDHLAHLVVHGILHLIGYDHEIEAEAQEMEELERTVLAGLGIRDPYAGAADDGNG